MIRGLGRGMVFRSGVAVLAAALTVSGCGGGSSTPSAAHNPGSGDSSFQPARSDFHQLRVLLARRARAVTKGNERAFLATVDGSNAHLVAQQRTLYANLAQLSVAQLSYDLDTSSLLVPDPVSGTDPVLRPEVTENLQLRGTMTRPVTNHVEDTFVRRDGHWLLGSEVAAPSDDTLDASQERPWFGAPIDASTVGPMTLMVDTSNASRLPALTREIHSDIRVDASLLDIPATYAVLVDATSNGASTSFSSLSKEEAAAVTFGLYQRDRSGTYLGTAGIAVKVNPHDVDSFSRSTPLLRHELTHYLLWQYVGSSPKWLSEGVANWVEFYPDDYRAMRLPADLYERAVHADRRLPVVGLFNDDPDVNYQIAQAAVAWLIAHYGTAKLLQLMKDYDTEYAGPDVDALTARLLREVYGVTEAQVVSGAFGLIGSFQH